MPSISPSPANSLWKKQGWSCPPASHSPSVLMASLCCYLTYLSKTGDFKIHLKTSEILSLRSSRCLRTLCKCPVVALPLSSCLLSHWPPCLSKNSLLAHSCFLVFALAVPFAGIVLPRVSVLNPAKSSPRPTPGSLHSLLSPIHSPLSKVPCPLIICESTLLHFIVSLSLLEQKLPKGRDFQVLCSQLISSP